MSAWIVVAMRGSLKRISMVQFGRLCPVIFNVNGELRQSRSMRTCTSRTRRESKLGEEKQCAWPRIGPSRSEEDKAAL